MNTMVITFTDGSIERVAGTRYVVEDNILKVFNENGYGYRDQTNIPLYNIKMYRWMK